MIETPPHHSRVSGSSTTPSGSLTTLALTGLGGWAKVMAQDCGVGALLAPMWDVDDALARRFAGMFYEAMQRLPGCTVAQAVAEARRFVRESRPHDPAWLAYSVYGHPNARVVLG